MAAPAGSRLSQGIGAFFFTVEKGVRTVCFVKENVCWVKNFSSKLKESMRFSSQGFALLASRLRGAFRAFSEGLLANRRAFPHEGSHLHQIEFMFIYLHRSSISPMKHNASSVFSVSLLARCAKWLELCLHPAPSKEVKKSSVAQKCALQDAYAYMIT